MSIAIQYLLPNTQSHHRRLFFYTTTHPLKTQFFTLPISPKTPSLQLLHHTTFQSLPNATIQSNSSHSPPPNLNLDAFLSTAELLCLAPSAILSLASAVNFTFFSSQKSFHVSVLNKVFVWQVVFLVGAVVVGALIRSRQWNRICVDSGKTGGSSFNLVDRIEKLEEDLRSSATIIRVLARQVEKLGIRFRVTRKTLKQPITETAALAQKNSEATRALAIQEDILEKELGEIQKVLLAMQEQQQKQLELILAIVKAGKPRDIMRESVAEKESSGVPKSSATIDGTKQMETQSQTGSIHRGANDRS